MHNLAHQFIAETFVSTPHAQCVAERLCAQCLGYCLSISAVGADKLLLFEDGCSAILRPSGGGLQMRVEGRDLVVFCGVRTLLQGQLASVTTVPTKVVEWQSKGCEPFTAFGIPAGIGRN